MLNQDMINDYSLEEKKIGKWINGKPVYRKIAYFQTYTINNGRNDIPFDCPEIENIIKIDIHFKFGGDRFYKQWDGYCTGNIILNSTTKILEITNKIDPLTVQNLTIIVEYTKTTD